MMDQTIDKDGHGKIWPHVVASIGIGDLNK